MKVLPFQRHSTLGQSGVSSACCALSHRQHPYHPEAHLCSVQYQLPVLTACDDVKLERHRGGLWDFFVENGMNGWRLRKKVPENVFNLFRSGDWGRGIGVIGDPFDAALMSTLVPRHI